MVEDNKSLVLENLAGNQTEHDYREQHLELVLVTGASGFIGAELVKQLVTAGNQVISTSRHPVGGFTVRSPAFSGRALERLRSHVALQLMMRMPGE
ncbi:NAD-dependent epimerase/dehydratase family protein [Phyllobacterium sp. LjRoot231]|uniref:NAD-dependent epimerase/dehydratase family protein n=1 Tax=Phyllobacterium sp. LjRoot231 TaxID=3342289 RepID=UPI003ED1643F